MSVEQRYERTAYARSIPSSGQSSEDVTLHNTLRRDSAVSIPGVVASGYGSINGRIDMASCAGHQLKAPHGKIT